MLLCPSDGHIEQPALFFEFAHRVGTHRRREDVLFEAHNKHRGEFQALCRVDGHQRHLIVRVSLIAVKVCQQRHLLQEVRQIDFIPHILFLAALHEVLHAAEKLFEVLLTGYILRVAPRVDILADAGGHDDVVAQRIGILRIDAPYPALDELAERLNLRHRALAHIHGEQHGFLDHLPEAHPIGLRRLDNLTDGGVADTARRIVDDALEGLFIVGVGNQPEVGNHVLDLLALVETQSAVDAIRDIVPAHLLLKRPALRVRAVEDGKVTPIAVILLPQPFDVLRHDHRLLLVRIGRLQLQPLAMLVLREHILRNLPLIPPYQRVGSLNDELRAPVVLLEFEEPGVGVLALEVEDVIDIRPPEGVDTLGIIAYDTHLLALLCELIDDGLLGKVSVLILIDEHEMELLNVFPPDILMVLKQHPRLHQQIIEVHRISLLTSLRVPYIYIRHLRALLAGIVTGPCALLIGLRQQQVVLGHRYPVGHGRGLVHLVVEPHLLDDCLHQRSCVTLVVDGEVWIIADFLCLCPQNACKHAVECAHLQVSRLFLAHQPAYAFLHLARCLVGKRQRQYIPRPDRIISRLLSFLQQPRDLIRQHPCLPRSCSRNHQTRPVAVLHRNSLTLIQLAQYLVIHFNPFMNCAAKLRIIFGTSKF